MTHVVSFSACCLLLLIIGVKYYSSNAIQAPFLISFVLFFVCRWRLISVQKSTRYEHGTTRILRPEKGNGSKWAGIENDLKSGSVNWAEFYRQFWKLTTVNIFTNKDFVRKYNKIIKFKKKSETFMANL